jgi:predicted metalloprotease
VTVSTTHGGRFGAVAGRCATALVVVAVLALSGCAWWPPGRGDSDEPPHSFGPSLPSAPVTGGKGTPSDKLAETVVLDVEHFWQARFPVDFDRAWINLHGFHGADPHDAKTPVPCMKTPADMDDQALYCPAEDIVEWDRTGLIPRVRGTYGDAAVLFTLAHEMGHAVQARLGIDAEAQLTQRDKYPTILLEGMADCYAGVVVHAAVDGHLPGLTVTRPQLDRALKALLSFRDPVGVAINPTAHGDAFDRVSAFLDGYQRDARLCAGMTVANRTFTQRGFSTLSDIMAGGNLTLPDLVKDMSPDADGWFGSLVTSRGHVWRPQTVSLAPPGRCPTPNAAGQGPARFCAGDGVISVAAGPLGRVHDQIGDYASGVLVASRYALATLGALGRPVTGPDAGRAAVCLAGAYTKQLFDRVSAPTFGLSPGDLDEAVQELLTEDYAARDASGQSPPGDLGLERIGEFRGGALGGPGRCGI